MTPPKESGSESNNGSEFAAPTAEAVRAELMSDVEDPESLARSLGVLKEPSVAIPVRVESELTLPPQAELKVSDQAQNLEEINADIAAKAPELQSGNSLAQQLLERQNTSIAEAQVPEKRFIKNLESTLDKARNLDELVQLIDNSEAIGHIAKVEDEGDEAAWYRAVPGDHKGSLAMNVLEQARQKLEKRSSVSRAKDGLSRAYESVSDIRQARSERKAHDKMLDEAHAENSARDKAKDEAEEAMWDQAIAENRALDVRRLKEVEDAALIGPDSFEDFVQQEIDKVIEPIKEEIRQVQARQNRLMAATERMPLHDRKDLEAANAHELDALYKKAANERRKAIEKSKEQRADLTKGLREQAVGIDEFERDLKAGTYVYIPDKEMHPEMSALLAGANGELVGADNEPFYEDEYDIDNGKGKHPTRMQILVYRTENPSLYVIEDWDKTSGKLKRQSLVKGTNVLVAAKENGKGRLSRGRQKLELSNAVYEKLGPVESKDVVDDSGTSSSEGYSNYIRNLTRTGGVTLDNARQLANPTNKKNKRTEGFIALLMKNIEQNAKKR